MVVQTRRMRRARNAPQFEARIVSSRSLIYRDGADAAVDRPAYVRAASSAAWLGDRLAVVQDDANFVALLTPDSGAVDAIVLPAGPGGKRQFDVPRGTKHQKLDLEACFSRVRGDGFELVALGSGSEPARERILLLRLSPSHEVTSLQLLPAGELYAGLRGAAHFSGSELNLEGALIRDERLLLFQRGNGARTAERPAINAIGQLELAAFDAYLAAQAQAPRLLDSEVYDLGDIDGVPYTFTDATLASSGEIWFLAAAEASTSSVDDGAILGTSIGVITTDERVLTTPLRDAAGNPSRAKAEGIAIDRTSSERLWLVVDRDDPFAPSELLEVRFTTGD
jgi:hypothetical protein